MIYIFKKLNSRTTKSGRVVVINSNMEEVFSGWVMVPVFDAEQSTVNSMAKCKEGDVSLMSVRDSQADTNIELVGFSGFAKRNVSDGREG